MSCNTVLIIDCRRCHNRLTNHFYCPCGQVITSFGSIHGNTQADLPNPSLACKSGRCDLNPLFRWRLHQVLLLAVLWNDDKFQLMRERDKGILLRENQYIYYTFLQSYEEILQSRTSYNRLKPLEKDPVNSVPNASSLVQDMEMHICIGEEDPLNNLFHCIDYLCTFASKCCCFAYS